MYNAATLPQGKKRKANLGNLGRKKGEMNPSPL